MEDPPRRRYIELAVFLDSSNIHDILKAGSLADRLEICTNRSAGGLTPSLSDFQTLQRSTDPNKPLYVMIRPRDGGDFIYISKEYEQMKSDLLAFKNAGASGFVFGILDEKNLVDVVKCRELVEMAGDRPCTFHRAFDIIPPEQMEEQLEVLIECGFKAVLTSGGVGNAVDNSHVLKRLVKAARGRIEVVVGGGVRSGNLKILRETGARWFHSSAVVDGGDVASSEELMDMYRVLGGV